MCTHSLRTSFLGSTVSTGGAWSYIGFNTSSTGPFTSNASTPPAALTGGVPQALSGDNPSIDWSGADDGYYYFTYTLSGCGSPISTTLLVHSKDSCFNSTVTINTHEQQSVINLNDAVFSGLSCNHSSGYWNETSGPFGAFDPISGMFYPTLSADGNTHTFEYVVSKNCSDCKSVVTVNVYTCAANDLCHYYTDFSETLDQDDLDDSELLSFKVGGVEQLTTPIIGFGTKNVVNFGSDPYLTNFVDALNALNVPCFKFYYSTLKLSVGDRQKFARFCVPQDIDWEIKVVVRGGGTTYWIYNNSGMTYSYDDVTYLDLFTNGFYDLASGITTGEEFCIVIAACE